MKKRSFPPARAHPDPRRADPQSQEHLGLDSHRATDGGDRVSGVGQVLASPSTRSTPRGSGATSSRSRRTRASSWSASTARTSTPSTRPPAIALEQKNGVRNARSTVGTQTEIHDSLRLLFAHGGTTSCPDCGVAAVPGGVDRAVEELVRAPRRAPARRSWRPCRGATPAPAAARGASAPAASRPPRRAEARRAFSAPWRPAARRSRSGRTSRRSSTPAGRCRIVVGRFVVGEASRPEIAAAAETAFALAGTLEAADRGSRSRTFRRGLHCPRCGREFRDPTPPLFSFNSPARRVRRRARASAA